MTPLEALDPYIADAAAPFSTSIDSISSMFMSAILLEDSGWPRSLVSRPPESNVRVLTGLPSTITKGSCPPEIVPVPRILKKALVPASPLVLRTSKPETFPLNADTKLTSGESSTCSFLTDSIDTPNFFVSCLIPTPVTTTDSSRMTSDGRMKSTSTRLLFTSFKVTVSIILLYPI